MNEGGLEGQEAPNGKDAEARDVLSPQIDELIRLGFHETLANPAYPQPERKLRDEPSLLETSFREKLKTVQLPEQISDPSNLVLVIPRLRLEDIADLQKIEGIEKWHWYDPSLDDDLPQAPYVIEMTKGEPNQDPKHLVKETQSRMRAYLPANSSFDAVSAALEKKN